MINSGTITGHATASNGLLDNQAGGSIGGNAISTLAAITNAGTVSGTVTAETDITNQSTGVLNGATITARTGSILNLGVINSAGALTIRAGGSITQDGMLTAGANAVNLFATGAISGSAGIRGTILTVRGFDGGASRAGGLNLTTGNAVTALDARTSDTALTFAQPGNITLLQVDTGTGSATIRSDGVISDAGFINAALLTVRGAAGGASVAESLLLSSTNRIGGLDVRTRGDLRLNLGTGTRIQQLVSSAGSVDVTANGTLNVSGWVGAGQDITLRAINGQLNILPGGQVIGGRAIALSATEDVLQTGGSVSAAAALTLTAGRDAIQTGGSTSAASLGSATQASSAGQDFLWNGGDVAWPVIHAVTAGRDLGLRSTVGASTLAGALNAGRNLTVETTSGALVIQNTVVRARTGMLSLRTMGDFAVFGADLYAGQDMALLATGRMSANASNLAAQNIGLTSDTGLHFTQTTLTATQNLVAGAGGATHFDNSSLRAATNFASDPSGFRRLRLSASGNLAVRNSNVTADRVEFVSGGTMTTEGSSFGVGTGLLLSARGGVGQANEAVTAVSPLRRDRLPLVIYDTRAGVFLNQLPDRLTTDTTDQPGRAFSAQIWQVSQMPPLPGQLFFGVHDGAASAPTSPSAGAININLSAGSSPVFLLLNGGTARGNLTAGRLGVHGQPGSRTLPNGRTVDLYGSLGGVGGGTAAHFGHLGSASGTQATYRTSYPYRFNNCVLSSVNCAVPSLLQIPTIHRASSNSLWVNQFGLDERELLGTPLARPGLRALPDP